ncbi:hypothetical protein N1851_001965 [Merluccius polli]|uniref:Uncharacterized protein n=1 Tax=Merluccius polli TaxID=89951 RepID=A0AA47P938_MERPO|nr:hypothetical protein N1851_001965 [Merluccius polli]
MASAADPRFKLRFVEEDNVAVVTGVYCPGTDLCRPEWRQRFQRYRMATKLNLETGDVQVSTLLHALGEEAQHVVNTFVFGGRGS